MVLENGVIEGHRTFGNIVKYVKMTASSNFGNMFSVLAASAFLPFLPMLPIHLLIQNLLYDISQTTIPFDRMDSEYLRTVYFVWQFYRSCTAALVVLSMVGIHFAVILHTYTVAKDQVYPSVQPLVIKLRCGV